MTSNPDPNTAANQGSGGNTEANSKKNWINEHAKLLKSLGVFIGTLVVVFGLLGTAYQYLLKEKIDQALRDKVLYLLAGKDNEAFVDTLKPDTRAHENLLQIALESSQLREMRAQVDTVLFFNLYRRYDGALPVFNAEISDTDIFKPNAEKVSHKVFVSKGQSLKIFVYANSRNEVADRPLDYGNNKFSLKIGDVVKTIPISGQRIVGRSIKCQLMTHFNDQETTKLIPIRLVVDEVRTVAYEYDYDVVVVTSKEKDQTESNCG